MAAVARLIYDIYFPDLYPDNNQFRGKFFIFTNVFFLSAGVFFQKKVIQYNPNVSLMVLIFYIFLVAFAANFVIYQFKFAGSRLLEDSSEITRENWDIYFSFDYFRTLLNVMGIYMMLILMEAFRYISLIYINKKGQISKVTIFGALHGFFVVLIIIIFEETTSAFDDLFIGIITIAYFLLFISKYFQSRASKNSLDGKILKFKRLVSFDEQAQQYVSHTEMRYKTFFYQSERTASVFTMERSFSKQSNYSPLNRYKDSQKSIRFIMNSVEEDSTKDFRISTKGINTDSVTRNSING